MCSTLPTAGMWNFVFPTTTWKAGTPITITATGPSYVGLFLKASAGSLAVPSGGLLKSLGCTGATALTHTSNAAKQTASLSLVWTPPAAGAGTVTFVGVLLGQRTGGCVYLGQTTTLTEVSDDVVFFLVPLLRPHADRSNTIVLCF